MSFPKINITFKTLASTAITRLGTGVAAIILDSATAGVYKLSNLAEMPVSFTAEQKEYVGLAFLSAPKVLVVASTDVATALTKLEAEKFNYVCAPQADATDNQAIASWVKAMRDTKGKRVKAVLANTLGNHEGIINFTTDGVKVKDKVTPYTAQQFTARIAGLLAGTGARDSVTFATLAEVEDITTHLSEEQASTKIDAGELILYHDGVKVKIARGVNSLTTLTGDKNASFKKIKLVEIMDMIYSDIKTTAEDEFIGKIRNRYENKLLLCNAINAYFDELVFDEILEAGQNNCELDIDATKAYLITNGIDVATLKPAEIKAHSTGDSVFIKASISMIDAIEIISFNIYL